MSAVATRKLSLAKETLRPLSDDALRSARGGTTGDFCDVSELTIKLLTMATSCNGKCDPHDELSTVDFSCAKAGICCDEEE